MKIIGLAGRSRAGKDTVANIAMELLHAQRGRESTRIACASLLKHVVAITFEFNDVQLYGGDRETVDPRYGFTPRHALQQIGTAFRQLHEDIWIERAVAQLREQGKRRGAWAGFITDIRYLNEACYLRKQDASIWLIRRPEADATPITHQSEAEIDLIEQQGLHTRRIANEGGTLTDLTALVESALGEEGLL